MRSKHAIAVWLSELVGVDASLSGDLLEEFARGRSKLWYCKELFVAIWNAFWALIFDHKLLALRAIATGVAVNYVWLFLWMRFLPLRPPVGTFNLQTLACLLVILLTEIATGWIIARTHRAHAIPMVALFALWLLIWYLISVDTEYLKMLLVDSLDQPRFRPYLAKHLAWLILTPLTEVAGLLAGGITADKSGRAHTTVAPD